MERKQPGLSVDKKVSFPKHLGYENLAEPSARRECHYLYPQNVVCLMNGGWAISRRKSQAEKSPPPWKQQQMFPPASFTPDFHLVFTQFSPSSGVMGASVGGESGSHFKAFLTASCYSITSLKDQFGQFETDPSTLLSIRTSQTYTLSFQHLPRFCSLGCWIFLGSSSFSSVAKKSDFPPMRFLPPVLPTLESHLVAEKNKTIRIHRVFLRYFPFTAQKLQQETKGTVVEQPKKGPSSRAGRSSSQRNSFVTKLHLKNAPQQPCASAWTALHC